MKQYFAFALAFVMLFSVFALAEDEFTLHNGVKFGMKSDEVNQQEAANGFGIGDGDYGEGTIAGYNGGVKYCYDMIINGTDVYYGVRKCQYRFYDSNTTRYNTLSRGLIDKYGPAMRSSADSTSFNVEDELQKNYYAEGTLNKTGLLDLHTEPPITGKSVEDKVYEYNRDSDNTIYRFTYKCPTYEQWLLPQASGGSVLIDHCMLSEFYLMVKKDTGKAMGDLSRRDWEFITYTSLTDKEVKAINANASAINDDL